MRALPKTLRHGVPLARWRRPDKIETLEIEGWLQCIALDKKIAGVARLRVDIDSNNPEPSISQSLGGATGATKQV